MRVVIESPLKSATYWGVQENIHYARRCLKDSLSRGESPFASHLLYPQVLDDNIHEEREQGITGQLNWIRACDLVAVYMDHGISTGMYAAIDFARSLGREIEYRKINS